MSYVYVLLHTYMRDVVGFAGGGGGGAHGCSSFAFATKYCTLCVPNAYDDDDGSG